MDENTKTVPMGSISAIIVLKDIMSIFLGPWTVIGHHGVGIHTVNCFGDLTGKTDRKRLTQS